MKKLIYTLLLFIVAIPALAQVDDSDQVDAITAMNPPDLVLSGPNGNGNGVVGSIPAVVDIGALGGATYTIPIQVPSGINGIQPDLSVVYNSQAGNGLLGWGWNLGGISAITRIASTLYHDDTVHGVTFGSHDRFALDGQRLIALDGATYGANGTEYKTEVDGMSKIVSYRDNGTVHGPTRFEVRTSDGLILEYGSNANSRLAFANGNNIEVGMWLLRKVSDRNGNYMQYQYYNDGESIVIDRIYYTSRVGLSSCYSVVFEYNELRDDVELFFIGNHPVKQKHLLERIKVKWWENELWKYEFAYETGTGMELLDYYTRISSITYTCGDYHYNPTRIVWGERPDDISNPAPFDGENIYLTTANYLDHLGDIHNNIKFSGDFNGDGLSDVIVVERADSKTEEIEDKQKTTDSIGYYSKTSVRKMRVYLNEGNSKVDGVSGIAKLRCSPLYLYNDTTNYYNLNDVYWIYVCDFNGDGLDDIITLGAHQSYIVYQTVEIEAFKSVIRSDGKWGIERVYFNNNLISPCWFTSIGSNQSTTLLTGDFMGRCKDDLILAFNSNDSEHFIYFTYNEATNRIDSSESAVDWKGIVYFTCDYNGDGKTEVWYAADGQTGKLVKICKNSNDQYTYSLIRNCFDSSCKLFAGDINGDGRSDILAYHPSGQTEGWEVVLGCVGSTNYSYNISIIMNNCTGGIDPGDYSYNFETRESNTNIKYFVGLADMDGDGKSDVVIRNNTNFYSLYGPLNNVQGVGSFARSESLSTESIGFNGENTYGICVGNFFGQENVSILQNQLLLSKPQHSTYYSVDSIVDGMGNYIGFDYDYLVHNPMKGDNIYTLSQVGQDLGLSIYSKPLPIRALKKISKRNLYANAPWSSQRFNYQNVLVHKYGCGCLGFKGITVNYRLADSLLSQTIKEFSINAMASHPYAVLNYERINGPTGHTKSECSYTYREYSCSRSLNNKVFYPAPYTKTFDSYDAISDSFFGRTIERADFTMESKETDSYNYYYTVAPYSTTVGTDTLLTVTSPYVCEFQTNTVIMYHKPDFDDWVIHRPDTVLTTKKHLFGNDADVKTLTAYEFELDNPLLVSKTTVFPGADVNNVNGLATSVSYEYDAAGNVTRTTSHALNNTVGDRTIEYEYEQFRSRRLERNALGYETQTSYNYYQELNLLTDCNGLETKYWNNDHIGLTNHTKRPDATYGCSALRWAFDGTGNLVNHAPNHAAYYTWDRSTGEAPIIVFYDASGRELRTVTEDMNGRAIYRDTDYDGLGRVRRKYEPRYSDDATTCRTKYIYDVCSRIDSIYYPDGNFEKTYYASTPGNATVTKVFHAVHDGGTRSTVNKTNVMGWSTESTDNSGTTVHYDYYPDGKLKNAGLNTNMEIRLQYDDAGNRTAITDPNYGHQQSTYNPFGELMATETPKGDVTEYQMDVLGRVVKRYDRDYTNNTVDSTIWVYGASSGEKGLLKSINYNNGKQTFEYAYDTLCRPVTVSESRMGGRPYQTHYGYNVSTGRISQITYPTGFVVKRDYLNGHLQTIKDVQDHVLWQTLAENANGQIVKYMTGNQIVDTLAYYGSTHLLKSQKAQKGSAIIQDFRYTYDDFRNLASRKENKYATPMTEVFKYDNMDRLDSVIFNNVRSYMDYDAYGRMTRRASEGNVVFQNAYYGSQTRPHAVLGADVNGAVFPDASRTITYTMHDKVKQIQQGNDVLTIDYGYDRQRIGMSESIYIQYATATKTYVGNCEYNHGFDRDRRLTYISGPMGVFAVFEELGPIYKSGGTGQDNDGVVNDSLTDDLFLDALYYLHRDHLGSITTITDENGTIVQELSYDAWGNLRNPYTWSGTFTGAPRFDRG
ncbi:MAG: VCBS repeat-containing protein, partial [Bacteroidales bacterium]|nr:VCBS repeat-containing protein [Bacteroidales bacterium]